MFNINHKNSWDEPINANLHVDVNFEPLTPFNFYVASSLTKQNPSSNTFHHFHDLPVELLLHIISFCDIGTLFQLMRTSPVTRPSAERLFWSNKETWYHVHGIWLLNGAFPGPESHCTEFLTRVKQVEIEFYQINASFRTPNEEQVHSFWKTFQRCFPSARRAVLSERSKRKEVDPIPEEIAMVVRLCPSSINVSVSLLQYGNSRRRLQRSLWHLVEGDNSDQWELNHRVWTRKSIIPPPKKFTGPVGAYQRHLYKGKLLCLRRWALRPLRLEVCERFHFDGHCIPFTCPNPQCDTRFESAGEWTLHAIDTRHDSYLPPGTKLPGEEEAPLREVENSIERETEDRETWLDNLRKDWGENGSEERQRFEEAFLDQLEHDPLYTHREPPKSCSTWQHCKNTMDPTYIYN